METAAYLILGGGVAGTQAADEIRRRDPRSRLLIIGEEPERLYSRISLPHYVCEAIPREQLFLRTPSWYEERNIELRGGKKAVRLETSKKEVVLDDNSSIRFGKLLIATGASPNPWPVEGGELPGVFHLRWLRDADQILSWKSRVRHAAIVGGSFISLEFARIFADWNISATLFIRGPHLWHTLLDETSASIIAKACREHGIELRTGEEIVKVSGDEAIKQIETSKGKKLDVEIVGVGIGIARNLAFVSDNLQKNRGIVCDRYLRSSHPDIFAAGDVAEFEDVILDRRHVLGNWSNAARQGQVVGATMAGDLTEFRMVSQYVFHIFGLTISFLGAVRKGRGEDVFRGDPAARTFARLILADGKLVGATVINMPKEAPALAKLIESQRDLRKEKGKLADSAFDLSKLF